MSKSKLTAIKHIISTIYSAQNALRAIAFEEIQILQIKKRLEKLKQK